MGRALAGGRKAAAGAAPVASHKDQTPRPCAADKARWVQAGQARRQPAYALETRSPAYRCLIGANGRSCIGELPIHLINFIQLGFIGMAVLFGHSIINLGHRAARLAA